MLEALSSASELPADAAGASIWMLEATFDPCRGYALTVRPADGVSSASRIQAEIESEDYEGGQ
jgi:hypothetical protein